ncbi:unnamed protein product [Boreogadus saida]
MSHTEPPPRWRSCPRRGQPVAAKFLPMKTMLGPKYDDKVQEENRFHPSMLSNYLKSLKVKMGLLVDLTNTTRFYDRNDIEKDGIKYVKLQCKGHGESPSKETTEMFITLCEHFLTKNPTELIGVHCTHGFNRTGFLICAYLVEKLDWSVEAAVAAFTLSRAPGIYKGEYLKELFRRYGDVEDAPPAPQLPEWCFEEDDGNGDVDDEGNAIGQDPAACSSGSAPGKRKKERMKVWNAPAATAPVPTVERPGCHGPRPHSGTPRLPRPPSPQWNAPAATTPVPTVERPGCHGPRPHSGTPRLPRPPSPQWNAPAAATHAVLGALRRLLKTTPG